MAAPITVNAPNVDGHVVTMFVATTATGDPTVTLTLPTYAPWIDLRIGHPVLDVSQLTSTTITNSGAGNPEDEMERGVAADSAPEWAVLTKSTVQREKAADEAGVCAITYWAYGVQKA
jgi:hypothetical protein